MLDIKFIRENIQAVKEGLEAKKAEADLALLLDLDQKRRQYQGKLDELKSQKNAANDEISRLLQEKQDPQKTIAAMKQVSNEINAVESQVKEFEKGLHDLLIGLPNLPHSSVPVGGADKNRLVHERGKKTTFDFSPKDHLALAEHLDIIDFKRAAKLSGANFILFKNDGARLERALYNFMLDLHGREHGYGEVFPPFLVNTAAMTGTGQLPKMEEDMYKLQGEDLYLIPTAEVPVTNIHQNEVLKEEDLPIYYTAYTACFRREAGSYGQETKGLNRVHQFDKVELVKFVRPEDSYQELERLLADVEKVFQLLDLPYRVLELATGDLSFAAAKCYDIEVYAAASDRWLEASSCSNFEDFQARRSGVRFKNQKTKKTAFVHTLNGSGVALPRTMLAILENYQTADGGVVIPEVLRPYMGGQDKITTKSI